MEIKITRKPSEKVLRASIGGSPHVGFYCVYRGDPKEIIHMLQAVIGELITDYASGTDHPIAKEDGRHTEPDFGKN